MIFCIRSGTSHQPDRPPVQDFVRPLLRMCERSAQGFTSSSTAADAAALTSAVRGAVFHVNCLAAIVDGLGVAAEAAVLPSSSATTPKETPSLPETLQVEEELARLRSVLLRDEIARILARSRFSFFKKNRAFLYIYTLRSLVDWIRNRRCTFWILEKEGINKVLRLSHAHTRAGAMPLLFWWPRLRLKSFPNPTLTM